MLKTDKIYIAGATGLVGSAIVRKLESEGYHNLITKRVELTKANKVEDFFSENKPDYVFLAAAKVGGILANKTQPVDFLQKNLTIQNNVIEKSVKHGVKKLLFLGSSCIYPKLCPQPIKEEYLLSGHLEPTNSAYAIAKIAGIELLKAYRTEKGFNSIALMPTNLYGPGDNFDLETSHVLPALISKFHSAKLENNPSITCWGTGSPFREFLHVDDLADACVFLMNNYESDEIINVGSGTDISIKELAEKVAKIIGYQGEIKWDTTKPDGTPKKLLNISKLQKLGWKPKISLEDGIKSTYASFKGPNVKFKLIKTNDFRMTFVDEVSGWKIWTDGPYEGDEWFISYNEFSSGTFKTFDDAYEQVLSILTK